jgi:hypothetical protein
MTMFVFAALTVTAFIWAITEPVSAAWVDDRNYGGTRLVD